MARARGFSLLEVIVTISLAAILAALGVLSHRALRPRLDLSAAVRQVAMDLKLARMRAVAHNSEHRLVFTDGSGRYQLQSMNGTGYGDVGKPIALPEGIVVAASSAISFRPRGTAKSFGRVTLRNSGGETRRVIVNITGQVRVQ